MSSIEKQLKDNDISESQMREHLASIVDVSQDAIISQQVNGEIISWNKGAEWIFGYTAEEMLGKNISILIPTDMQPERNSMIARLKAGEQMIGHYETTRKTKTGRLIDVSLSMTPLMNDSGALVATATVERDITQGKQQSQEKQKQNQDLELKVTQRTQLLLEANKELEAFAYAVSHDLRTPLRALSGFSVILLEEYESKLDDTGKDYLRRISLASKRMGDLIDDLLGLSRIGRSKMNIEEVDLTSMTEELRDELEDENSNDRKVRFTIDRNMTLKGDKHLIRIALQNLINNAWKFTANVEQAQIAIGASKRDGESIFFVRDNGVGFDMANADKLFTPFERLHSHHEFAGNGIGLAIVNRIVQRHGGRIWAEAEQEKGACFYFTLQENEYRFNCSDDETITKRTLT